MPLAICRGTPEERFWNRVYKTPNCWFWIGVLRGGYGVFALRHGKAIGTHKFSWQLHFGEVPKGKCVCHTCDIRQCVRPDHLYLGTVRENTLDSVSKGTQVGNGNVFKTHCKRGHPFSVGNTMIDPITGNRRCRTCVRKIKKDSEYRCRERRNVRRLGRLKRLCMIFGVPA